MAATHSNAQEATLANYFWFVHTTGRFNQLQIAFLCINYNTKHFKQPPATHLVCGPTKTSNMTLAKIDFFCFKVIFFRQLRRLPECDRNIAIFVANYCDTQTVFFFIQKTTKQID